MSQYKSANDSEELRKIENEILPMMNEIWNEISFDKRLYDQCIYVRDNSNLKEEQLRIINFYIKGFEDNGIHLPKEKQERLKEISKRLSDLSRKFWNNVLDEENAFEFIFEDESKISEMPADILDKAKETAINKWKSWYYFNMSASDYGNILSYCSDSKIRKKFMDYRMTMWTSWDHDNRPIALEILKLRQEMAQLIWKWNFAEYILEDKMATKPKIVKDVFGPGIERALSKCRKEVEMLKEYFELDKFWEEDFWYYARLYKKEKFNLDPAVTRRYYEFDDVFWGLQDLARRLFNIEFKKSEVKPYTEKARYYEIFRWDDLVWYMIFDPFFREKKTSWAWNAVVRRKSKYSNNIVTPLIFNVSSYFEKWPHENLIWHAWATTMFHEFWHAMHNMLSKSDYPQLCGTNNLERDFCELPSTLMEYFVDHRNVLKTFARDYQTWEIIPEDTLNKYDATKNTFSWSNTLWLFSRALLDMEIHDREAPNTIEELEEIASSIEKRCSVFENRENSKHLFSFKHLFYWSYACNYYSYWWADILSSQIFEQFEKDWIFSREVANKYVEKILSVWSTKSAYEQFKDFAWEEINPDAYLRKLWL